MSEINEGHKPSTHETAAKHPQHHVESTPKTSKEHTRLISKIKHFFQNQGRPELRRELLGSIAETGESPKEPQPVQESGKPKAQTGQEAGQKKQEQERGLRVGDTVKMLRKDYSVDADWVISGYDQQTGEAIVRGQNGQTEKVPQIDLYTINGIDKKFPLIQWVDFRKRLETDLGGAQRGTLKYKGKPLNWATTMLSHEEAKEFIKENFDVDRRNSVDNPNMFGYQREKYNRVRELTKKIFG